MSLQIKGEVCICVVRIVRLGRSSGFDRVHLLPGELFELEYTHGKIRRNSSCIRGVIQFI